MNSLFVSHYDSKTLGTYDKHNLTVYKICDLHHNLKGQGRSGFDIVKFYETNC